MTHRTLAVALTIAVLAGIVSAELVWPVRSVALAGTALLQPVPVSPHAPDARSPVSLEKLLTRPLFSPSRRPPVSALVADRPLGSPPRLAGTLLSPAGRMAIFGAVAGGGKATTVVEGDRLGEFIVLEIGSGTATLLGPDVVDHIVQLAADKAGRSAGLAAIAPAGTVHTAPPRLAVLDVLRTIPGETARLGPPGGPVPSRSAR